MGKATVHNGSADALLGAVRAGEVERVRELLGAEPALASACDHNRLPATMLALYYGHRRVAELLLEHGAPVDVFLAAALGRVGDLAELVRADPAAIDAYSPDGWTALHLAAFFRQRTAAEYLIGAGANVRAISRNEMRNMPLHAAAAGNSAEIVAVLIDAGAYVDARQAGGFTALHSAAQNGNLDMARLLLANRADPNATTDDNKTALILAQEAGHEPIVELLRQHGALH